MSDFVYERKGNLFVPTQWAGSPWAEGFQHGGPVNALFALAAEEAAAGCELDVVRMTVDLFRPVPRIPLELSWRFIRRGRRLANVECLLTNPETDELISRSQIVLLKPSPQATAGPALATTPLAPKEAFAAIPFIPEAVRSQMPPGFHMSFSVHLGTDADGPGAWITTPLDLLPQTPMSPLQRSAAVADLSFALSMQAMGQRSGASNDRWIGPPVINTDTSLYWQRPPQGDWFGFRPSGVSQERGIGIVDNELHDAQGLLGRIIQATLVQTPETKPSES